MFHELLWAIGRVPETESLDWHMAGVKTSEPGYIVADEYQNNTADGIYALGDVTGQLELTPGKLISHSLGNPTTRCPDLTDD